MSLDSNATLLPCPFCGAPAERIDIEDGENAGGSCVSCTRCLASSNVEFGFKENFVGNWNARSQPSEWVATNERMPEPGVRVLFAWRSDLGKPRISAGIYAAKFSVEAGPDWDDEFADYHEGSDTYYRPEGFWEEGWDTEECALIKDVASWMPLPKPPALLPPNVEAK